MSGGNRESFGALQPVFRKYLGPRAALEPVTGVLREKGPVTIEHFGKTFEPPFTPIWVEEVPEGAYSMTYRELYEKFKGVDPALSEIFKSRISWDAEGQSETGDGNRPEPGRA